MNDIIKVILLNFILFYFLIKKNKSLSMFLIVILFMYVLYLRGKKILEGQSLIEDKKDEVKFMKMANLDRLLNKMLNVYEHSEEDCIGGYSDFSPCDKKCGITHKYKTYRVERPAGIFGKSCLEEDGRRKKKLCDESDGIYKCIIGESCQEDGDCDSNNCDPKTDRCVAKRVCSNTNLDLCNKEECLDLNNHYDYAKREFKYDETESGVKCKLEDQETDSEEEEQEEEEDDEVESGYDPVTVSLGECDLYYWLEKRTETGQDQLTSTECVLKIPNSVYLESVDDPKYKERLEKYGLDKLKLPGLYCNIGKQYKQNYSEEDSIEDRLIGITEPISESMIEEDFGNYNDLCITPIHSIGNTEQGGNCEDGYWPPYRYFDDVNNQYIDSSKYSKISIFEMCGRCKNGFQIGLGAYECVSCDGRGTPNNQYIYLETGEKKVLKGVDDNEMGQNVWCTTGGVQNNLIDAKVSCTSYKSNPRFQCINNNQIWNSDANGSLVYINDENDFYNTCCKYCENNDIITFSGGDVDSCTANNFNSKCNQETSCTSCTNLNLEEGSGDTYDYRLDYFSCESCPADYQSDGEGGCQPLPERGNCSVLAQYDHSYSTRCTNNYVWFKPDINDMTRGICKMATTEVGLDQLQSKTSNVNIEEHCTNNRNDSCCQENVETRDNNPDSVGSFEPYPACNILNINLDASPSCVLRDESSERWRSEVPYSFCVENMGEDCVDNCPDSGNLLCEMCCNVNNH